METSKTVEVEIQDVAFGGKGVARHEGKAVFVPYVLSGEIAEVQITRDRKKFAEAELVRVVRASEDRVTPECPYFGVCGGCAYQHIAYERQLQIKAKQVEQALRRIGKIDPVPMHPAIPSPRWYGYRNRIRVHSEGGVTGFYSRNRDTLVDIEQCPISAPEVNAALARFRARKDPEAVGDFTISARDFEFFEQTNDEAAALLLAEVRRQIGGEKPVLVDAYCGSGFFAFGLRDLFQRVVGIEENEAAIRRARGRADRDMTFLAGDVAAYLGSVLQKNVPAETVLVVDPPAAGLSARVVEQITSFRPAVLFYVSCDPGTLGRDLGALSRCFQIQSVTPLDMFPQTAEIETIVQLTL